MFLTNLMPNVNSKNKEIKSVNISLSFHDTVYVYCMKRIIQCICPIFTCSAFCGIICMAIILISEVYTTLLVLSFTVINLGIINLMVDIG